MSSDEKGFTIVDKRGQGDEPEAGTAPAASAPEEAPLPQVDFTSFVLSLATSALYHMGLVADPETGEKAAPNLPVARQTIDTLALLDEKTRGNLTDEEAELMKNLLTDLRMRCVQLGE